MPPDPRVYSASGGAIIPQNGSVGTPLPTTVATPDPALTTPRTVDTPTQTTADPAQSFLDTFRAPESREVIQERLRKGAQGAIDALNVQYDNQIAAKQKIGEERKSIDSAISVMSGLAGSTEAGAHRNKINDANQKELDAVNNERSLRIQQIYADISSQAETEARAQLADATASAESIVTRRAAAQEKTIAGLKEMASAGLVDYDAFRSNPQNKKVYDHAVEAAGGEDQLRAMFVLNRPKNQIIGTPTRIGNAYVQAYQNPLTGKVSYEKLDLPVDLPVEYNNFQQMGDNLVAIPDNWDGDVSKLKTVGSTVSTQDRMQQQLLGLQIKKAQKDLTTANIQTQVVEQPDGSKVLINSQTGAVISTYGGGKNDAKAAMQSETLAIAQALRDDTAAGKNSAIGASMAKLFPKAQELGLQGDRTAYEARVDTLKARLTLDNLKLLKGAMSDKDLAFLQAVGSSLNPNMNKREFNKELDKVITTLGNANVSATPAGQITTAPDGTQVQIID